MALLVLIVLLALACFALLPLARLIAALPDSNEDFVFCGEHVFHSAPTTPKPKTVIPAQAGIHTMSA